ncbi:MAG: hypothetical protein IIT46_12535 [Lachnospiraceae bacterium]|nr:hypothetical protein [Lachnospiraceae bacterium]
MSAIYGMCHWGTAGFEPVIHNMEEELHKYKIDRFDTKSIEQVEFGCGLQYFTSEADREELPYYVKKKHVLMTADIVLDNRKELLQQLGIEKTNVPDGTIAYEAYCKWGEEFVKLLRGVFAIAVYDFNKETLFLFTDHTGSRCVNYYNSKKGFVFSTTFAPILKVCPEIKLSEKWLVACGALQTPDMEMFEELTPYDRVLQLDAGCYLKVTEHSFEKVSYWNPLLRADTMAFSDDMCKLLFLDTFKSCVKDVLRSSGNTAATVSSGLDSTSVASVTAGFLEKEGKKLYSYTSVPDGKMEEDGGDIYDESWGPQILAEKYKNIRVHLVPCEGMDGFTKLERLVDELEVPTKSAPNMMWIDEIYKKAAQAGCKLLVKGQYGNATISFGKLFTTMRCQLKRGSFIQAYKEVRAFGSRHHVPRKKIIKQYMIERKEENRKEDWLLDSYVHEQLLQKYSIGCVIDQTFETSGKGQCLSMEQIHNFQFDRVNLAQLGMYDTRFSLIHGILVRDPTKDKRLIELCMNFPVECYAHDGIERRIARNYMRGIVPDAILDQYYRRGLQSADYARRIQTNWDKISEDVLEKLSDQKLLKYFDEEKLQVLRKKLANMSELSKEEQNAICACALNMYSFSVLLNKNGAVRTKVTQ